MEIYKLPRSLAVNPLVHRKLRGELSVAFASGILCETYCPLGLDSLWSLIGVVASLREPFSFEINESMTAIGIMGGFREGSFCFFKIGNKNVIVFTASQINPIGSSKVKIDDDRHGTFFWIPDRAMMSFEQLISVGNSVLLGEHSAFEAIVGQSYANWVHDIYANPETGQP